MKMDENQDLEILMKQVESEIKEEFDSNLLFFKSDRFSEILSHIKETLKSQKTISQDPYKEILFNDVTNEEFVRLFSCLFNQAISDLDKDGLEKSEYSYYIESVTYQKLRFIEIHGQGTEFIVEGVK